LIALTLAALIKFTAAPLLALYLVLLMRRAYQATRPSWTHRSRAMASVVIPAGLFSVALGLALYLPYWFGFTPAQILATFTSPPSAQSSYGSFLYAIIVWMREHPLPAVGSWQYSLLSTFSQHRTWELINTGTLAVMLLIGSVWIWRRPSTTTLALSMQATLGVVLIVTFWFHAWYITWVIGLTAVIISRQTVAQVLFGLTFSASALAYYLFANYLSPIGGWNWLSCLLVFLPPLCTLLAIIYEQRDRHAKQQEVAYSHSGEE
jgi:hypothetical protein